MEAPGSVLLLDVRPPYDAAIGRLAVESGLRVLRAGGHVGALADQNRVLLCVTQLGGAPAGVLECARALHKQLGRTPLVVLGERLGGDLSLSLARRGAADVIEVPAPSLEIAARALACRQAQQVGGAGAIVGASESMRELRSQVCALAPLRTSVLLQGETGTGKGLVARTIHELSPWAAEPWVHVDCSALSPSVIESELFGHERGSFTGASGLREGRFELAGRGTIFLDEIGDLDRSLQTKLLRVLHDREFERVGGKQTLCMQARVIAATSRDLRTEIREGRFRSDLYFRLAVSPLRLPALRERSSDIPLLVQSQLPVLSERLGLAAPRFADSFFAALRRHSWPGNVRELLNVLERCLVQFRVDLLEADDLTAVLDTELEPEASHPASARSLGSEGELLETRVGSDQERRILEKVLLETGGNVSRAARRLGVHRSTLRHRIRAQGLAAIIPRD